MWLIWLAAFALIIVALLLAPMRVVIGWSGWLVQVRLRYLGMSLQVWTRNLLERSPKHTKRRERAPDRDFGSMIEKLIDGLDTLVSNRETLEESARSALRLLHRFGRMLQLERGQIDIKIGMANPAYTGVANGMLWALSGMVQARWPQLFIRSLPDFDSTALDCSGEIVVRFRVWQPVWESLRFLATLPWRGLRKMKKDLAYS